jgi:hypothetical protein
MNLFKSKKPHYEYLRKKWTAKHKAANEGVIDKHLRRVALGSLGGMMLLSTPGLSLSSAQAVAAAEGTSITATTSRNLTLANDLKGKLPTDFRNLNTDEEKLVATTISADLGIKVTPQIDGKRLNRTYGIIGGEQHLPRYAGDNVFAHATSTQDWAMFGPAGITPGKGAWGYFTDSKETLTPKDEQRERWYIAVQTFLSPDYNNRVAEYRDFYKYRKMLVVNPKTGQAVVTDIADAGPAEFTGKHLGGSPEVMHELGLASGPRKGEVLYFFIDDPNDTVPLGPVKLPINQS